MEEKKGTFVLVSAPSGGGKNAIIRALLKKFTHSTQLVTTTTRDMRPLEADGVDYHFLDKEIFKKKLEAGEFVEYNEYDGNFYGTQWTDLNEALEQYDLVFSQAEVNGKKHLDKKGVPHISIFLLPEDFEILRDRIKKRGGTSDDSIDERLEIAKKEVEQSGIYDLRVVNEDGKMEKAVDSIVNYLVEATGVQSE
ncbi:MAG: guanylate kinase [Candidatus Magasanikbacteria bacterium]|jgi:guanylate kinase|nr:guanylate kinase [Candidatus Magasanikbacteria bacterium]MBT4071199.1 guanylate kinase [Candidatus Magasanikbacteria bacterium]